jgi:putative transposase
MTAPLRAKLKELASQRRRFGYRHLGLMLARQGIKINHKKLYRLYREERLTVCRRVGRKPALCTRTPMTIPQGANLRWSIDFVADTLATGRRFCILTMVDDFTRELTPDRVRSMPQTGKLYPPAIQSSASLQGGTDSPYE